LPAFSSLAGSMDDTPPNAVLDMLEGDPAARVFFRFERLRGDLMVHRPADSRTAVAAVLVACLLSLPAAVGFAQTAGVSVPRMVATVEGEPNPVTLHTYHAAVSVHGLLAKTSITLGFVNHSDRDLEGELLFALPEGATVTGYALDVGDLMVDAVAVEKEIGRLAFETEARGEVDPGLVEWADGNVFRTRVYPVPADGSRRIRVDSVSLLDRRGGRGRYTLPLSGLPALETLDVELEICGSIGSPPVFRGVAVTVGPEDEDGCLRGSGSLAGSPPERDLVIETGVPVPTAVQTQPTGDGEAFFVVSSLVPDDLESHRQRRRPSRPLILWDASASRGESDHDTAIEAVLRLVDHWRPAEISLTVLRDEPETPRPFRVERGSAVALEKVLREVVYDGACRFDRETAWTGVYPDAVILVSDGRPTLGAVELPDLDAPVFAVSVSGAANRAALRELAGASGGALIDLSPSGDPDWMSAVDRIPASLANVEVLEGTMRELNAPVGRPVGAATILSGILVSESARLRLHYGDRGRGPWLDVEIVRGRGSGFESSYWATRRIAALVPYLNDYRSEIRRLGLDYDLTTPLTSLIVLEGADQYARYRIEPPASLPEMRIEYRELLDDQMEELADLEQEYEEDLRRMWLDPPEREAPDREPSPDPDEHPVGEGPADRGEGPVEVAGPGASASARPSEASAEVTDEMIEAAMERSFEGEIAVSAGTPVTRHREGAVLVSPWKKETPYFETLEEASRTDRYDAYLRQRAGHSGSPGFFVDCARLFLEKQQVDLGFRVLSNLLEIRDDEPRLIRIAAMLYLEYGRPEIAVELLERLAEIRPEHPQSNRDLALALVERARTRPRGSAQDAREDLDRAAELLSEVTFTPWGPVPDHLKSLYLELDLFPDIGQVALVDLNALSQRYRRWFRETPDAVRTLDPVFIRKVEADLRIVITWDDAFADIDLRVTDPAGELVWYEHPRSEAGGVLSDDYTDGLGPEVFTLERAPAGLYRVEVDYFADDGPSVVGPVTVMTAITTDLGRSTERTVYRSTRLDVVEETMEVATVTIGVPADLDQPPE
jgi:tetratricopeptide (TPR) repeat protein